MRTAFALLARRAPGTAARKLIACCVAAGFLVLPLVAAHAERPVDGLPGDGVVPDPGRAHSVTLDVCKTVVDGEPECAFQHIQAAIDAAPDGALIRIWPGLYLEEPSRAAPDVGPGGGYGEECGYDEPCPDYFTFEDHVAHPNAANLVALLGKRDVTLRGMGDDMGDVVIDAGFTKHIGLRVDRADGAVLQNFEVWHAGENGFYVMDTDGVWSDNVGAHMSASYELFYYAVDHGVMRDCDATGGGDSAIYLGGLPDTPGRHSVELANCKGHHSHLGYSGTQGNSVWVHDNEFYDNAIGLVSDSEADHPNYPQKAGVFERNVFRDNNLNVYDGVCDDWCSDVRPKSLEGIVMPVGTGVFLPTGQHNLFRDNVFARNEEAGFWLASGQGLVIGPTGEPMEEPVTSDGNVFIGNVFDGNGLEFMWDGLGRDNCWKDNVRAEGGDLRTDGAVLPPCDVLGNPLPGTVSAPNPVNAVSQASLLTVDGPDGTHPICHYTGVGPCGGGAFDSATQWPTAALNTPEGFVPHPPLPACGPSDEESCWS